MESRAGSFTITRIVTFFSIMLVAFSASAQITGSRTGWIIFDDSIATELELRDTQLERLHEIDRRYHADHERLGDDPRSDPNYQALTQRRNAEIQTVLDNRQYAAWLRINDQDHEGGRAEPGPQSSEMDRRDPQGNNFERDSRSNVNDRQVPKTSGGVDGGVGTTP